MTDCPECERLCAKVKRLDAVLRKRAPKLFPIQAERDAKPHPMQIPWEIAELAYSVYAGKYGTRQSLERLAERGGFGPGEMDTFLPDWRERVDTINQARKTLHVVVFDRVYDGEAICDVNRDVMEALDSYYNKVMEAIPGDEYGLSRGKFRVTVDWLDAEEVSGE